MIGQIEPEYPTKLTSSHSSLRDSADRTGIDCSNRPRETMTPYVYIIVPGESLAMKPELKSVHWKDSVAPCDEPEVGYRPH